MQSFADKNSTMRLFDMEYFSIFFFFRKSLILYKSNRLKIYFSPLLEYVESVLYEIEICSKNIRNLMDCKHRYSPSKKKKKNKIDENATALRVLKRIWICVDGKLLEIVYYVLAQWNAGSNVCLGNVLNFSHYRRKALFKFIIRITSDSFWFEVNHHKWIPKGNIRF